MILVYRLSLWFYVLAIHISSLRNPKAKLWLAGRRNWHKSLRSSIKKNEKTIWFHCASLGEFEQGRPVIEAIKKEKPAYKILLTFFSPSGYEIRKNYSGADHISYLPIDSPTNARKFIKLIDPQMVFFVKYEFWYFYMHELHFRKTPVYLISAIFRSNQIFFKNYGKWYRKILKFYNHIFVQNRKSKELLKSIGVENVSIAGDTRFDRVADIAQQAKELPVIEKFKASRFLIVAGSTWPSDENLFVNYIGETEKNLCLVIAPHEIKSSNIARLKNLFSEEVLLYSEASVNNLSTARIMIIDNIGLLSSIYKYAEIAFVGGAFKTGLHNVLEPACFSIPVVFGPEYSKFREAGEMINNGAAISISDYAGFKKELEILVSNKNILAKMSTKAGSYIETNRGASSKIISKTSVHLI
ncbi:MAG: glycosyltransferase N-terminal domain-containing protein [Bacteroidota bacterium]|nr:glycosyltransferase N-terminal domain-containing protein [Bacteroidota bacterium]